MSFGIRTSEYFHIFNLINELSLLRLKILKVNNCADIPPSPTHTHKGLEMELTVLAMPCHYQFYSSLGRHFEYHRFLPPFWPMNIQSFFPLYNWKELLKALGISLPDLNSFNLFIILHIKSQLLPLLTGTFLF